MRKLFLISSLFISINFFAQDTTYAREIINKLTSKHCFGRGYLNNGLQNAEAIIIEEIKLNKCEPLFSGSYTQSFFHNVNTFPEKCEVKLNGKELIPGVDYILNPSSHNLKGKFDLTKKDSITYNTKHEGINVIVTKKNKLTYSVSASLNNFCEIELDKKRFTEEPKSIKLNIENKFISNFESKNIGCYINGTANSDSMIVFSAHYDHLGGMGKDTYFPGANDNASGVSVVLNLIKYYSKNKPKYKTVFLFFAGEEAGLLGSKFFVEKKSIDLKKIKFLINLDLLGTGDDGIMVTNGYVYQKQFFLLNDISFKNTLIQDVKRRGKAANSDHYWFTEAGVPSFFIYTLGGISAYHDVYDVAKTLPLTDYLDVCTLLLKFIEQL
jgi:aminopeptidase YwaD